MSAIIERDAPSAATQTARETRARRRVWPVLLQIAVHCAGVGALIVPLLIPASSPVPVGQAHAGDAPILLALLMPLLIALAVGQVSSRRLDAKGIALLGVLCGLNAVLRIPGGLGGASLIFFLPIVCGAVYGPTFGFLLGALSFAVSGVVTGGIGPWLPFQMLAAGWVGAGAGLLRPFVDRVRPGVGVAVLCAYGYFAGFFFGAVTDLWFWPWFAAGDASIAWRPGLGLAGGARAFWRFYATTSLAWDAGRAIANVILIATLGAPAMRMLRRRRDHMWTQPPTAREGSKRDIRGKNRGFSPAA